MTNLTYADFASRTMNALAWVLFGSIAQALVRLLTLAVLARLLTPADFGLVALSMMLGTFVLMLSRIGFGPALVQKADITPAHISAAITIALPVALFCALTLFLSAQAMAGFFEEPQLISLIQIHALIPLLLAVSHIPESLLQRELRFRSLTLVDGVSNIFGYGLVSITSALMGFGAISVIYGLVAQEVLRFIALFWLRTVVPRLNFKTSDVRDIFRFGFGLSFVQTTNAAAYQLDNFVVSKFLGAEALGLYSRAYQVITVPTKLLGNSLIKALFPAMSLVQSDRQILQKTFLTSITAVTSLSIPVTIIICCLSTEIVAVVLGEQWGSAVLPFTILGLAIVVRVGHKVCEAVIRASGVVYKLWLCQSFFALKVFLFSYVGHYWGLGGVSVGVLLASVLNFLLLLLLIQHLVGVSFFEVIFRMTQQFLKNTPIAALLLLAVQLLRDLFVDQFLILTASAFGALIIYGILFWFRPSFFGEEGEFIHQKVSERINAIG